MRLLPDRYSRCSATSVTRYRQSMRRATLRRAGIVIEADGLGGLLAEAQHPLWTER
jgi:hypothetical protein